MIKVYFRKDEDGRFVSLSAEGHAMSGEAGHDLVCAAVSTLTITCVNNIERLTEIKPIVQVNDDGGYLYAELPEVVSEEDDRIAQILLENCYLGLKEDVAKSNSQYLKVYTRNK